MSSAAAFFLTGYQNLHFSSSYLLAAFAYMFVCFFDCLKLSVSKKKANFQPWQNVLKIFFWSNLSNLDHKKYFCHSRELKNCKFLKEFCPKKIQIVSTQKCILLNFFYLPNKPKKISKAISMSNLILKNYCSSHYQKCQSKINALAFVPFTSLHSHVSPYFSSNSIACLQK